MIIRQPASSCLLYLLFYPSCPLRGIFHIVRMMLCSSAMRRMFRMA